MIYRYGQKLRRDKKNIKKYVIGAAATVLIAGAAAIPALAASNNASPCGATHGAFANVNGNFGFLGAVGGTPGYHYGAVGQDPGATGYNNSNTDCQSK